MKKAFLCIAPYQLYPPDHGGNAFIWNKLKALAPYYDVHVLSPEPQGTSDERARIDQTYKSHFAGYAYFRLPLNPEGTWHRTGAYYRDVFIRGKPAPLIRLSNSKLPQAVEQYLSEHHIDFLLIEHGYVVPALAHLRKDSRSRAARVPWVVVEHNVESMLALDGARFKTYSIFRRIAHWWESRKMRQIERQSHGVADGFLYISAADKKHFERPGFNPHLTVVTTITKPLKTRKTDFARTGRIIFFGTLEFFPNFDGLIWFAKKVWPEILTQVPDAKLVVAGGFSDKLGAILRKFPSLEFTGALSHSDLDQAIVRCDVFISPIRLGSGIKIKNIVAMNLAMPIVATHKSVAGMPVRDGKDLLLADDPSLFAKSVVNLLESEELRRKLSEEILNVYEDVYKPDRAIKSWVSEIDRLLGAVN